MSQPGPMGWGLPNETIERNHYIEKKERDAIIAIRPALMQYRMSEPVNQALIDEVKQMVKNAGWDDGFSFRFLFAAVVKRSPDWLRQLIGSCVASGDMRATVYRMLAEIFILHDPEELPGVKMDGTDSIAFFAPYSYRAGRREAGINGRSDGSLCLPHIRGKMKYGHLPCNTPGLRSDRFPEPKDEDLYKDWGADNRLMDQFVAQASKLKLLDSPAVKSVEESHRLIDELVPQNNCSGWGFKSTGKKLGNGPDGKPIFQWTRSGTWQHNMTRTGWYELKGKRYTETENSWDDYHDGNRAFCVEQNEDARWVKDSEVQGVGNIDLTDSGPVVDWGTV